ncbi:MAG TPA: hypothetical protein VHW64_16010 [Nocardioides sp.]|uniref:hypothetical protein n=1 Tax=Nocardioides sp. TaxID=35761 RepID=UPI002E348D9A|nr:hypothetical protein [Nocardioides sp.]HEX3932206.1 hypothetical protein [Nocardioides sp.]
MSHTAVSPSQPLDAEWLGAPSRRSRFRIAVLAALAVLLVFLGGVEVQKRWGAAATSASAASPFAGSLPAGGFRSQTTPSGATTPAVIGKVTGIHGHTWTVRDLGGKDHTVTVTARTTLTRSVVRASGPIRTGSTVTVQGSTQGHTVVATAITIR